MKLHRFIPAIILLFAVSLNAFATPTLQVHGVDSMTGNLSADEDTWFL